MMYRNAPMGKGILGGEIISPGVTKGVLCFADFRQNSDICSETIDHRNVAEEISRFDVEVNSVINELKESIEILKRDSLFGEAEIIQAHVLILEDDEFRKRVHEKIRESKLASEIALEHTLQEVIALLEGSENIVFSERTVDFRDIEIRLKKKLSKEDSAIFSELLKDTENPVVATRELLPSLVLEAKSMGIHGFIVEQGTSYSHAAILAKSFGFPVLKIGSFHSSGLEDGRQVLVDAIHGQLLIDPTEEDTRRITGLTQEICPVSQETSLPVKLWLNIFDPSQIEEGDLADIAGIGLYRTEILFMQNKEDFPTEDEQFAVYSSLFEKCRNKSVTIRTLDIGGDKALPYFSLGPQENPFLGFRGHRIYRFHPDIFITQIRAILKAGIEVADLRILYPMIETVDDLVFVQGLMKEAINSLESENIEYRHDFQEGVLLEVPSAIWNLKELLGYVDFAGVGTNDLLQYFFAVDRNSANVQSAYQPESPVALRMLKEIIDISRELDKPLCICGEIASNARLLPILIGLGFDHLSVAPNAVPVVRNHIAALDISECRELAERCLGARQAKEVKAIINEFGSCSQETQQFHLRECEESTEICPVCKMVVHVEGNRWMIIHDDKELYFCCKSCKDRFLAVRL